MTNLWWFQYRWFFSFTFFILIRIIRLITRRWWTRWWTRFWLHFFNPSIVSESSWSATTSAAPSASFAASYCATPHCNFSYLWTILLLNLRPRLLLAQQRFPNFPLFFWNPFPLIFFFFLHKQSFNFLHFFKFSIFSGCWILAK